MNAGGEKLRILLYSHDTVGLGHLRRNQAIACGLAKSLANPTILMVSGARQCTMLDIPKSVGLITIPSIKKTENGNYSSHTSGLSMDDVIALRREMLRSITRTYRPDLFIVDKVPRGIHGELTSTLEDLRSAGKTRCVLGLRDILDDAQSVRGEWDRDGNEQAIHDFYDAVWVYGDRRICDVVAEYRLTPQTASKVTYTGYLDRTAIDAEALAGDESLESVERICGSSKIVLCMVGGGEDGARLAIDFAHATFPPGVAGIILVGPFMPSAVRENLHQRMRNSSQLHVLDFVRHPEELVSRADRVVAMGGYNTVCELLSRRKKVLIVPRVTPRTEQLIRAERMQELGLLEMLHPSQLNPGKISDWICGESVLTRDARQSINLGGLARLPQLVAELCQSGRNGFGKSRGIQSQFSKPVFASPCPVPVGGDHP